MAIHLSAYYTQGPSSVNEQPLQQELPAVRQVVQQLRPDDVFNAEETALLYYSPLVKTIPSRSISCNKRNKTTFTIHLACNSTGTVKLEPFPVGKDKQPRPLKKSTAG